MAGDKSSSESYCLWHDTAAGEDILGFKPYVEAIAEFLTAEETLAPITLSIEGQWGCGKSSFMKQLEDEIEKKNISKIKIKTFLAYLLSKSENKIPDELGPIKSFLKSISEQNRKKKSRNLCSFKYKIRATIKYISSKIKRRKYFAVWFNCWRYEKEDELWAAFSLNFIEELSKKLPWYYKIISQFRLIWRRYLIIFNYAPVVVIYLLLRTISFIIIFLFLFLVISYILKFLGINPSNGLGMPSLGAEGIVSFSGILTLLTSFIIVINHFFSKEPFTDLLTDPFGLKKLESNTNYKERLPFREHFYSDFNEIIKSYVGNSKVYVFIDDLDRAEVPKAAELMQAINLMISDDSKVYFSLGMDRKVISAGLAAKNEKVLKYLAVDELEYGLKYGYDFIEKFIQLPFKVPSPQIEDFKEFMNPLKKQEISSKAASSFSVSLDNLLMKFNIFSSSPHPDPEESVQSELIESIKHEGKSPGKSPKGKSEPSKPVTNDQDCDEKSGDWNSILEMVVPALDRNPRRVKQFFNLFRFQRTIGYKTGLFSHDGKTELKYLWNCRKLAKFVVLYIEWPELVYALGSNSKLLEQLEAYELKPENKNESLEKWIKDKRLISLLRFGCEENDPQKKRDDYTLSGLDFSKLLQISPVVPSPEDGTDFSSIIFDGIEFIPIPSGNFIMGSPEDEVGRYDSEGPQHKVNIKNPFYLGKYPVTQKQWEDVMDSNPSYFKGDDLPVESVSWDDVQEFIKKLNEIEGSDKYRLPSEAEWEYACRARTTTRYSFGDDESRLNEYAWYSQNSGSVTHPVGQRNPNPWGLYDMYGNVWEWVQGRWHDNYNDAPSDGSVWEDGSSSGRLVRGGGWSSSAGRCRSASRGGGGGHSGGDPDGRSSLVGFRLLGKL